VYSQQRINGEFGSILPILQIFKFLNRDWFSLLVLLSVDLRSMGLRDVPFRVELMI
jgi:hypothetical protein